MVKSQNYIKILSRFGLGLRSQSAFLVCEEFSFRRCQNINVVLNRIRLSEPAVFILYISSSYFLNPITMPFKDRYDTCVSNKWRRHTSLVFKCV